MSEESDAQSKPSASTALNDKIADILLKVLMTGGVAGGGVGAFWSLFKERDTPKAIVSAVIGLGISYGAKLLQPIHKGTEERLEKLGAAANQGLDRLNAAAIAKITAVEDRYFACQAADCETCATEGMARPSGIFTPMLEKVFVPLELDGRMLEPGLRRPIKDLARPRAEWAEPSAVKIWDLLAQAKSTPIYRQIAILAWGGYGKTTLMRHIAYTLGKNQQPQGVPRLIPVLLLLRKYRNRLTQPNAPDLAQLITEHHIPSLPVTAGLRVPTNWAKSHLQRGRMVVMFDGFDEIPQAQRPLLTRWLQTQLHTYRNSVFILTSRPKAYTEQPVADRLDFHTLLWVRDFNRRQRQAFVQQWYWCQEYYYHGKQDIPAVQQAAETAAQDLLHQIAQRAELTDLAKNPLLLNMIAMFHRHDPSARLPKRRVELYQQICQLLLKDRPGARQLETLMDDWAAAQIILQMLALTMMQQKVERLEQAELLTCLTEYLQAQEETVTAREFLQVIEQISELLVQREPGEYEFAHLSFQEFLAAKEIVRRQQVNLLYDHVAEDWWKPVILLYAAQVKPSGLIRGLLQRGATDLAYACWQETSKRIDADLQQDLQERQALGLAAVAVQTSRYAALESYLKAQQWIEADQETYRLMITAVGKEEGQWFTKEELLTFPCAELRAIDRLWVQYSQGHFGFSVQQQIYVECGATLDGKYPGDKIWEAFGDRVGWRSKGASWLTMKKLAATLNPPLFSHRGKLPLRGVVCGLVWWFLFSRTKTCEL